MKTEECKKDIVKGRRLTDKEYWRMIFFENVRSEIAVDEMLKMLNLNKGLMQ